MRSCSRHRSKGTTLREHRRKLDEIRVVAEGIEVWLRGDHIPEVGVDIQRAAEVADRQGAVAGEAPVTSQVVVEDGFARIDFDGALQRIDRLRELACAFVAPTEGQQDVDVVRDQIGAALQWQERFFIAGQFAERLTQQVTGSAIAVHQTAATLERTERMFDHAEFEIALGFFDGSAQH